MVRTYRSPTACRSRPTTPAAGLLLFDKTSGRIIRLDPRTGAQTLYSTVPDLPTCSNAPAGRAVQPRDAGHGARFLTTAAWGPDGSLYVTDYDQGVIFRIPPAGGPAQVWLSDPRLDGGMFGTACILLMPDHHTLLFDQASNGDAASGAANPTTGKLYEVGIGAAASRGRSSSCGRAGRRRRPTAACWLAQATSTWRWPGPPTRSWSSTQTGHELARFGQQYTGANNSSMPFDTPSGLAYLGTELIVANQSYIDGNTANMALLNVETGEPGLPLYVPANAGPKAPAEAQEAAKKRHKRHRRHKRHKPHPPVDTELRF